MAKSKRTAAAAAQTKVAEVKGTGDRCVGGDRSKGGDRCEGGDGRKGGDRCEGGGSCEAWRQREGGAAVPMKAEAQPKPLTEKKTVEKTVVVGVRRQAGKTGPC